MSRFNIFNRIHKGLRAMLFDAAQTLQQTDYLNPEDVALAFRKLNAVLDMFAEHARHEDAHILPAIQHYEPSLVDSFEKEHEEDHALVRKLKGLMLVYRHAQKTEVKIDTGDSINRAFESFLTFNLVHMSREEAVLNKVLWRYYSDEEIKSINTHIVAGLSPKEKALTSSWIMRGLNTAEVADWLREVERSAPAPVYNQLFRIAEKEISSDRFRKILDVLSDNAMVA